MTTKERIEFTQKNMIDASNFVEPEKIPVGGFFYGWPFAYAGATYRDLIDDPEAAARAYVKCFEEIDIDFLFTAGVPAPVRAFEALGNHDYAMSEDGTYVMHQQALSSFFGPEFYDMIVEDPDKFYEDTFYRFKCPVFRGPREEAYAALKKAAVEFKKYEQLQSAISRHLIEEKGVYSISDMRTPLMFTQPFQPIFMQFRGIRDSLSDLRRRPDKVRAAVDVIWARSQAQFHCDPKDHSDPFPPGLSAYHAEAFISPQQYDELYLKYFMERNLPFMEAGKKFILGCQGNNIRTLDRLRRLPRASMIVILDEENPFEAHKLIGDWATLVTGMPVEMLATATKEACVDYVKRCFDTFAPGGGFMFMTNQALLSAKDAKVENVLAAYETANELSRK